jgi:hypothetical protein
MREKITTGNSVMLAFYFSDALIERYAPNKFPEICKVYTVRTVNEREGVTFIRLEEIVNEVHTYQDGIAELEFNADAFSKITIQKQSTQCNYPLAPYAISR